MNFNNMSDEQIREQIALSIEKKRINKKIKATTLAEKGGHNTQTYSNFINRSTDIKIGTLIQILRGLGELDKLEAIFDTNEPYSPLQNNSKSAVRIRTSSNTSKVVDSSDVKNEHSSTILGTILEKAKNNTLIQSQEIEDTINDKQKKDALAKSILSKFLNKEEK